LEQLLGQLRAAGDGTRLRLLLLLREAELTVSELTQILAQSQPRVSRHLKLLCAAGFLQRFKEGSWVFYRAAERGPGAELLKTIAVLTDPSEPSVLAHDRERLAAARAARAEAASAYFRANAPHWERIRSLHVPEREVEEAIVRMLGNEKIESVLDAGTGTGRILELLSPYIAHGVGVDVSPEMLTIARDRLARSGARHCQVRLGDVYHLPFFEDRHEPFDAAVFHQVLHYLDDPPAALREAMRVLKPGGRVLIVDFAPHQLEFLRREHAHRRLGFSDREVQGWFKSAGLKPLAAEQLAPRSGEEKLTVMLWLASTPVKPSRARDLEAAA
jgi:ubiquinone/menaquinone biosynthesis C-methylase UbiE